MAPPSSVMMNDHVNVVTVAAAAAAEEPQYQTLPKSYRVSMDKKKSDKKRAAAAVEDEDGKGQV